MPSTAQDQKPRNRHGNIPSNQSDHMPSDGKRNRNNASTHRHGNIKQHRSSFHGDSNEDTVYCTRCPAYFPRTQLERHNCTNVAGRSNSSATARRSTSVPLERTELSGESSSPDDVCSSPDVIVLGDLEVLGDGGVLSEDTEVINNTSTTKAKPSQHKKVINIAFFMGQSRFGRTLAHTRMLCLSYHV